MIQLAGHSACIGHRVKHEETTQKIIGAAIEVHNLLGPGFLESIYERSLVHELQLRRFSIKTQIDVEISYKELVVGKHRLDIVVENLVVLELKACSAISDVHVAQAALLSEGDRSGVGARIQLWRAEAFVEATDPKQAGGIIEVMEKRRAPRNGQLEEALTNLIQSQTAFLARLADMDRERVELKRESNERFTSIENILLQQAQILEGLPEAIRQKIGFKKP